MRKELWRQQRNRLNAINSQLKALDDEEAELRRRLESGELTAEEEAALRARLAEIERMRNDLMTEQNGMASNELHTVLQPLKPSKAMQIAAARRAAELRSSQSEGDLFASRTFKPLQEIERHRIQPLWPSLTRGTALHNANAI